MPIISTIYREESFIYAKYTHPQSEDFLEYKSTIQIKDTGKQPVIMKLRFDGIHPSFAPMPPEEHTIKAANIIELFLKLGRWFQKYGYAIK
jgi:hypothetical protein